MNRPAPISVFSDQHRTKSTTRSRTSCGTHTWVRAPQDFFLKRCARPSTRPTPRPWSGSSFPGMRFVVVLLGGPGGPCLGRRQRRSRRTLFASGRIPLAATPVPHTDRKSALCPTSAVSGWQPSLLRCSAFAVFPCVLSVILTEERPLQFQMRQDNCPSLSLRPRSPSSNKWALKVLPTPILEFYLAVFSHAWFTSFRGCSLTSRLALLFP